MPSSENPLLPVVSAFYEAATEATALPGALRTLMRAIATDTSYSALYVDGSTPATLAYHEVGDESLINLYVDQFAEQDIWVHALMNGEIGRAYLLQEMVPIESLKQTAFFGDFLQPNYDILHALGVVVSVGSDALAMFGFHRIATHEAFGRAQQNRLELIAPHLARALHLHRRYVEWSAGSLFAAAIDKLQTAMLIVDAGENIVFANGSAERLLQQRTGVRVRNKRLLLDDARAANGFASALSCALSGLVAPEDTLSVRIPDRRGKRHILASIFPLAPSSSLAENGHRMALVVLIRPRIPLKHDRAAVSAMFNLSAAEARLADLLCQGIRLEVASELLRISRNTARNQLAAIFNKTGVNRQSDLIALLSSLAAP